MTSLHGIAIRDRKTKRLVRFVECDVGREALRVLGGVRINLNSRCVAEEEVLDASIVTELESMSEDEIATACGWM